MYDRSAEAAPRKPRLHRALAPTAAQLSALTGTIAHRVCRHLARQGWLEGEGESAFLADSAAGDDAMDTLRMSSITYRIATGAHAGRKVATLQTLPADADAVHGDAGSATAPCVALPPTSLSAQVGGFSLHAGVAAQAPGPEYSFHAADRHDRRPA